MSSLSSVSHVSQSVCKLIFPNKIDQEIGMTILYHINDKNLQLSTDFSQLSSFKNYYVSEKRNPRR